MDHGSRLICPFQAIISIGNLFIPHGLISVPIVLVRYIVVQL